jgi:thioesterase domain-containing protein
VYNVPGGHSSMLQEPNVQVLAENMQAYIDAAIATVSNSHQIIKSAD